MNMLEDGLRLSLALEALQQFSGANDFFGWHNRYAGAIAKARLALGGTSTESPTAIDTRYLACVEAELREAQEEARACRRAIAESSDAETISARVADLLDDQQQAAA